MKTLEKVIFIKVCFYKLYIFFWNDLRGALYSTVHWKWVTHESAKECWNGIAAKIFLFWKVFLMQADSELGNLRAKHSTLLQKCFCKMRPLSSRRLTMKNSKKASEWIFIQNISCGFVQKVSCHISLKTKIDNIFKWSFFIRQCFFLQRLWPNQRNKKRIKNVQCNQ